MDSKPVHYLLVEDDDDHAELVRMALAENRLNDTVERVADGDQGLSYLQRRNSYSGRPRPDVILLDLKLPGMTGHELLSRVKRDEEFSSIPVVILTTSAIAADRARAYADGANSYLVKPVDFEKFHEMVKGLGRYWSIWNQPPG